MYQSHVNVRYAKSLFLLANEKGILDIIRKDIDLIYNTFQESEEFNILIEHPTIKPSKKSDIITKLFKGKVNEYTLSFLLMVIKNKRENHLKSMCVNFIGLYRRNKGIKTAVLTTAYKLSDEEKSIVKKAMEKKFEAIIELSEKVDSNLIGGMIIQIDDKQLDLSVARQIQILRNRFLHIDFNNKKNIKH